MTELSLMDFETLRVEIAEAVCTVTLNRPERLNAMNRSMRRELAECFEAVARDTGIRAVILTGAGRAFSGGGDINDFTSTPEELHSLMGRISHRWFKALWGLPQPVVIAVNGVAGGGGANLALCGDIVYASQEASFVQTFLKIGLVPDLGGMFLLPRLVGLAKAKEMALLGERVSAEEALELGLVARVFAPDELMDRARSAALRLARSPASAVTLTKRIMNRSFETAMEAILDNEWMAQSFLFSTEASQTGVAAFLTKGKAAPSARES
jgi:enoyl-CoA hydratase/carnithine racemase